MAMRADAGTARRADLRFRGSAEGRKPAAGNVLYVYEKTSPMDLIEAAGAYTRYGDVRPLLAGFDDGWPSSIRR